MSMRSPARANGGSSALTMTTAAFLLRMSWGATETPKLETRDDSDERSRGEAEESPFPFKPGHEAQTEDLVAPDAPDGGNVLDPHRGGGESRR